MFIRLTPKIHVDIHKIVMVEETDPTTTQVYIEGFGSSIETQIPAEILLQFIDIQKERKEKEESSESDLSRVLRMNSQRFEG